MPASSGPLRTAARRARRHHWSCGVAVVALLSASAPSVLAQWPRRQTPAVPRNADGTPNLTAPAPRAADGHIDLSGLWNYAGVLGFRGGPPPPPPGTPVEATFWNIEAGFTEGLPFQPWGAEVRRQRMAANSKDNPDAACLPPGLMQLHTHSQPRKVVQTPELVVMAYEANAGLRQIVLDGRAAPSGDAQPWWYGYSRGRWDGDTLVVETTNFRDDGWLDVNGAPLTSAGRVTERFRRPSFGRLEIDVTIDDPTAYTRPWTVRVNQRLLVDGTDLIEFVCLENQKFNPSAPGTASPR